MKLIKIYSATCNNIDYSVATIPISTINLNVFKEAFKSLIHKDADDYTESKMKKFVEEGYTESRVSSAAAVSDKENLMILFTYYSDDITMGVPVGLAIIFDKKFYAIDYSQCRRAESELLNIYKLKH